MPFGPDGTKLPRDKAMLGEPPGESSGGVRLAGLGSGRIVNMSWNLMTALTLNLFRGLAAMLLFSRVAIGDHHTKDHILEKYLQAIQSMETSYAQVQGVGTQFWKSLDETSRRRPTTHQIEFARDGDGRKVVETLVRVGTDSPSDVRKDIRVSVSNADYVFVLNQEEGGPYVIINVGPISEEDTMAAPRGFFDKYVMAPYSAFAQPISAILTEPSFEFRLREVSTVEIEGRDLVRIDFEFRLAEDFPVVPASLLVDPAAQWALHSYEGWFGSQQDRIRAGTVEYGPPIEGVPVPRRVTYQHSDHSEVFEIEQIALGRSTPARTFTLTAFGLPEVMDPPRASRGFSGAYWLFGLALLFLTIALILRYVGTRFERTSR
ncbi:hypothetical protein BH23PLA1_BH23PLA1_22880 [soil metagenome]